MAQAPAAAEQSPTDRLTPTIDGAVTAGEWDAAGFYTAGGGGYGSPAERDSAAVARDIKHGYLTAEMAREAYGVLADAVKAAPRRPRAGK